MGRIVLSDYLELRQGPDIIHIKSKEDGSTLFLGFYSMLRDREELVIKNFFTRYVKSEHVTLETRHKFWKEKGLMAPLLPEVLPQYEFKDMQQKLIYEIEI